MSVITNTNIIQEGLTMNLDVAHPTSWNTSVNVFRYPTDPYRACFIGTNGYGGATGCDIYRDTIQSPVGNTPLKMVVTSSDGYTLTYDTFPWWNLCAAESGQTWTFSYWAKANTAATVRNFIFEADSYGNTDYTNLGQSYQNVTTSWQRYSFSYTMAGNPGGVQFRFGSTTNGATVWFDGIQIEPSSSASAFNPNCRFNPVVHSAEAYPITNSAALRKFTWKDLTENKIDVDLHGTLNYTTLGGVPCLGFNNSMYWQSSVADAQKTDYRYGATIEMWLYNQTKANRRTVFQKNGNTYNSYEQELAMTWEADNSISCYRNYNTYDYGSSGVLNNNAWNHCILVLYPYLSDGQWYVNGAAVGSYTKASLQLPPKAGAIMIGNGYAGKVQTGGIAILRTYRRMFDLEDAQQNYQAAKSRFGL